jgi:putative DNA primase/helicase
LQPTKLFEYLRGAVTGGAGDDGLAQRFQLLVYPDIKNVWTQVDRPPDIEAADKANSIFVRLAKIDPLALGAVQHYPGAIPVLRFDQTAQENMCFVLSIFTEKKKTFYFVIIHFNNIFAS